jgi:proteasome assembly chaperone (PAC2) family protein
MQPLIWEHRPDSLRAPALVCAFTGWNDAGDAASSALSFLGASLGATRFAQIDPEEFYDFQSVRPKVKLIDGETREIVWPAVEVFAARVPRAPRDLVLLGGPEPSMRWRGFTTLITDLAEALSVQLVVTLGALLADVPHSLPVHISGSASDQALAERLGLHGTGYEGPTGIVGVLHATCAARGIPSASLWASVPHYVAAAPNPKAALALVRKLEGLVGVAVDASELRPPPSTTSARSASRCSRTPTCRRSSSGSSRWRPTSTPTRPRRSPPATASLASSSGSSGSAAATTPRLEISCGDRRMRRSRGQCTPFGAQACTVPRAGACTSPNNPNLIFRRPGRRSGTRTSSTPRVTGSVRRPAP